MQRWIDLLAPLVVVGAAALAAYAAPVAAQATAIAGVVTFEGGVKIPEGRLEIYIEKRAAGGPQRRLSETRVESGGGSEQIAFSLPWQERSPGHQGMRIVARLERADGWLVARGSAPAPAASPVRVILSTVTY